MQVIDNPKEDAKIPIVQNGTNYSMPFGTLNKLLIQIYENSDSLKQVSDAATEVACRLAALTDAENNISAAEEQREVSVRNALEDIAEASGKAEDTAAHPGYVDNDGYYYKWNVTTRTYEKTDTNLKGEKGDTFTFDDLTDEQVSALMAPATDAATNADAAADACNTATTKANDATAAANTAANTAINSIMMYDCSAKGTITFATLDLAIAAVPLAYQKGGLHIKFVDTASNKYNTYFLTTPTWSTSTADWQYSNENIEYAKNGTGVTVPKGKVVYINSSTGENPIFQLATNADYAIASRAWGMTYESINNNAVGKLIHFGMIENIDTSAYTAGTELWLGTNGEYTSVRPTSPAFQTSIGMVIRQSATVGSIFVNMRYVNIEGIRSQNTNTSPSSKLFDDSRVAVDASIQDVYKKSNYNDGDNIIDFNTIHLITDNPEFICVAIDTDDKILYGIKADGQPYFGVGCPQQVKDYVNEQINKILGTDDISSTIDSLKEIESFLKDFTNSDTLKALLDTKANKTYVDTTIANTNTDIANKYNQINADIADKYKKSNPNDEEGNVVDTNSFKSVINNPEYFKAFVDNTNKLIEAIGLDGVRKFFVGIEVQGTLHCVTDNPEYIAVEIDANGKVLSATNNDGSHYIHKVKSETIPEEFEHIEDPEGRTEITTDEEDKILGYRDSEGIRHEHKISANHINLSDDAAKEVNEAFKSAGIKMENPSDFSKDSYIELPIPRVAAQVRLYAPKLPTTKTDDIEAEIEYNDKDGNYFRKPVILNAQGSSSMSYYVKNMAIDINDESKIKFGDFPAQDGFHLKKYYIDAFRGQCIVGYHLIEQMYMTRPYGERRPWDYLNTNNSVENGTGSISKDFDNCSKSHPDGFPIRIIWVNSSTKEETVMGVYAWNLKKSREVYNVDKEKAENIILDGEINSSSLFGGAVDWTKFEIRNPKSLLDINGNKYDGDNPKELSDTDSSSKKVKDYIIRLSGAMADLKTNNNKETFEKYFNVPFFIDYFLQSQVTYNTDGFNKNWIWGTLNGQKWNPNIYDEDSIFGLNAATGAYIIKNSDKQTILGLTADLPTYYLSQLYEIEIKERYKELRDAGVFTVDNIVGLLESWLNRIGYDNLKEDLSIYKETPSYRAGNLNDGWEIVCWANTNDTYVNEKTYNEGDTCIYYKWSFKATKTITGIPPTSTIYEHGPVNIMGFYNSIGRVKRWLVNRINFLDSNYNYNI